MEAPAYDVFISHASEDKRDVAEPLAKSLEQLGYKVWLDKQELHLGDQLRRKINQGLSRSRYGVVILSKAFFSKSWPMEELDALMGREDIETTIVLPIRHGLSQEQVRSSHPTVANKLSASTDGGLQNIVKQIAAVLGSPLSGQPVPSIAPTDPQQHRVTSDRATHIEVQQWTVPLNRNHAFTARKEIFLELEKKFSSIQIVALTGMPGIGKTQTAVEYAYRFKSNYNNIFWANADTEERLNTDFNYFNNLLGLSEHGESDYVKNVAIFKRWLTHNDGWLLILDNADDLSLVYSYLPVAPRSHVLITTRDPSPGPTIEPISMPIMSPSEGGLFLLRRARKIKGSDSADGISENDFKVVEDISKEVGGLPLALDQAGAFVNERQISFYQYLNLYKKKGEKLRARRGNDPQGHESVTVTFSLAFDQIKEHNSDAVTILRIFAFLHPDNIPDLIIIKAAQLLGEYLTVQIEDRFDLLEALGVVLGFSILGRNC